MQAPDKKSYRSDYRIFVQGIEQHVAALRVCRVEGEWAS
jgi:hypothetical protein